MSAGYTQGPCPACGSSDALTVYFDRPEWGHCFSCGKNVKMDNDDDAGSLDRAGAPARGGGGGGSSGGTDTGLELYPAEDFEFRSLSKRKIAQKTCERFEFGIVEGQQVAWIRNQNGKKVGQHVRRNTTQKKKRFYNRGIVPAEPMFYGQWLWRRGGENQWLVITEGYQDCHSVAEAFDLTRPVVSLPNGCDSVANAFQANLRWLASFSKIILWFDDDDPGRAALEKAITYCPLGKTYVVTPTGAKDANELHVNQGLKAVRDAVWNAAEYRPDGILTGTALLEAAREVTPEMGLPWFSQSLTDLTMGRRFGETYLVGAPPGAGKTDFLTQQIAYDIAQDLVRPGVVMLEQKPGITLRRTVAKIAGEPFYLAEEEDTGREQRFFEAAGPVADHLVVYDSFGETDPDEVFRIVRFLSASGCRAVYLDHITAMMDPDREKESIRRIVMDAAKLAQELDIILLLVSHLATPSGTPHEEGGEILQKHFYGSRAIAQWAHGMFGLRRNQRHPREDMRDWSFFECIKDRLRGGAVTGHGVWLGYDHGTSRLLEGTPPTNDLLGAAQKAAADYPDEPESEKDAF